MDIYIGTVMQFAYYVNRDLIGWAHCNGQVLPVKNHEALFSLIGFGTCSLYLDISIIRLILSITILD
jgi:microcystin-dependent protein